MRLASKKKKKKKKKKTKKKKKKVAYHAVEEPLVAVLRRHSGVRELLFCGRDRPVRAAPQEHALRTPPQERGGHLAREQK
jgi:hypothetical protein